MKKKLMRYFACMTSAAILLTVVIVAALVYGLFERRVMADLRLESRLVGHLVENGQISQAADVLGRELRMTLIDAQGVVLFDNGASTDAMDNHAQRPEVNAALAHGEGMDVRQSSTLHANTYYYAIRLADGSVLRMAEEASSIFNIYVRALPTTLAILLAMVALCIAAANVVTRRLIRPVEQMAARPEPDNASLYPELEPFVSMIRRQHEEILRSADMRVQFTANVSHELKTPLTSISGYAELIENGMAKGDQAQKFAAEIRKSANRLLTLINDIIRLSQMDSPASDLCLEVFDASQVAADVVEQLRLAAQKMEVELHFAGDPVRIEADRRMVEELIFNLCENAIRYNVRGGDVFVEVSARANKAVICVKDTGIGISKEHQARVFERFYRVDKGRSKATGGTGLGLAIVKHIAARHHASLSLESELGRGTIITAEFDGKPVPKKEETAC